MIACVDAHYRETIAVAACVLFRDWDDERPVEEVVERIAGVQEYVPGSFYLRELPCLARVLGRVCHPFDAVIVDGYVWLDEAEMPGLGAHLSRILGGRVPVIGVAKSRFKNPTKSIAIYRGRSARPLFVSSLGIDLAEAAERIRAMGGEYRIPSLLKRVDELCRTG